METRHALVARQLAEAISSGAYAVGTTLPTELELADQFKVSRATVRTALGNLQQLGLVSRRRKAGTRVEAQVSAPESAGYTHALATVDDLLQYAAQTHRRVEEIVGEVADDELAARLQCRPGRRWLRVSSLRVITDKPEAPPICWTDVYVNDRDAELVRANIDHYADAIGSLLEQKAGRRIAEVVQTLRAIALPAHLAEPLHAVAHAPALEITRRYLESNSNLLIVSISVHAPEQFAYTMKLKRQKRKAAE